MLEHLRYLFLIANDCELNDRSIGRRLVFVFLSLSLYLSFNTRDNFSWFYHCFELRRILISWKGGYHIILDGGEFGSKQTGREVRKPILKTRNTFS